MLSSLLPPTLIPWCPSKTGPLGAAFSVLPLGEAYQGQEGQMGLLAEMLLIRLFLIPLSVCQGWCWWQHLVLMRLELPPCSSSQAPASSQLPSPLSHSLLGAVMCCHFVTPILYFTYQLSLETVI